MAKIPAGILGAFLGKAGPVSGHMWNGQNIIRTSSRRKDNNRTSKRKAQQQKIKICNDFTTAFTGTGFFNKSFPAYGNPGSGYNRATGALMNQAIAGTDPDIRISYPHVLISRGPLPAAENASAALNADGNLLFTWTDNSDMGTAKKNDTVILLAFFPALKQIIYSLDAATRKDCQALLITNIMAGYAAETWMGFLSTDEKDAANSVYTGRFVL